MNGPSVFNAVYFPIGGWEPLEDVNISTLLHSGLGSSLALCRHSKCFLSRR